MRGAQGYLNKGRPAEEVADAIRRAARGQRYLTDTLSERLLLRGTAGHAGRRAAHEELSPREREVFQALVAGRSAKEVAFDLGIGLSSVHTYTERIKRKLGAESAADLVRYAHRHRLLE
ncbi:MAG: DNA-binding response regulator [Myxococcota bacterium]